MLAARPSLLVVLSGGSSYRIGASGSFPFFSFFAGSVTESSMLFDAVCTDANSSSYVKSMKTLYQLHCQSPHPQLPRSSWLF